MTHYKNNLANTDEPIVQAMAVSIAEMKGFRAPGPGEAWEYWPGLDAVQFVAMQRRYAELTKPNPQRTMADE